MGLFQNNFVRAAAAMIAVTFVAGCGGGGGGGGGAGSASSSFNTTEFQANYGLGNINALTAYDNSATGSGKTVAVVDTGIDQSHTELSGNLSANSASVGTISSSVQDTEGHGTSVAGVVAAARNSVDTHGVAFNATILAVKASEDGSFSATNLIAAADFVIARGADVVNLSLGSAGISQATATALQRVVDAGIVVVASSGNSGASEAFYPARLANCSTSTICDALGVIFDAKGLMIAVGATDSTNGMASFSNLAGDTASAYLVAPGVSIVTTALGGGTTTVDGTSLSAPHVSGAVALILQRFPGLSAAQAVDLLLDSATDLGAAGTDTTFGRGLLNLKAAFAARGLAVVPLGGTVKGISSPLGETSFKIGSAFGDALSEQSFFARTIILDAYQRAYHVDLRDRIDSGSAPLTVTNFIGRDDLQRVETPLPAGLSLAFDAPTREMDMRSDDSLFWLENDRSRELQSDDFGAVFLNAGLGPSRDLRLGFRSSADAVVAEGGPLSQGRTLFSNWTPSIQPEATMLNQGSNLLLKQRLSPRTEINFAVHRSAAGSGAGAGRLARSQVVHQFKDGLKVALGAGYVSEQGALFRSSTSGAFGQTGENASTFVSFAAAYGLTRNTEAFASYTEASARPEFSGQSLFSNWDRVRANAYAVGLTSRSLAARGDLLGLSISQPLRVYAAGVDLTLPVGRDAEGHVFQETRHIDLSPSGRQTDVQLAYRRPLSDNASLASFAALSFNPGHVAAAKPAQALGLKLEMRF